MLVSELISKLLIVPEGYKVYSWDLEWWELVKDRDLAVMVSHENKCIVIDTDLLTSEGFEKI